MSQTPSDDASEASEVSEDDLRISSPAVSAAGISSINMVSKLALREMGLIRGARILADLNDFGGFDCPGCAWPDPDDERSHFEFCENGVKAVADEEARRLGLKDSQTGTSHQSPHGYRAPAHTNLLRSASSSLGINRRRPARACANCCPEHRR